MKSKLVSRENPKTFILIFETGDEVMEGLQNFAENENLNNTQITAIGAFSSVTLGYFDLDKKDYIKNEFDEQLEVLSLIGNISRYKGKPKIHLHISLGKRDAWAVGGHLLKGVVSPTLEVVLTESPEYLKREFVEEYQLPLINPEEKSMNESGSEQIGRKTWVIPEGYIPPSSTGPEPQMLSHETACILNLNNKDAHVEVTVYFSDEEPVGPYKFTVMAQRTKHIRFNDLKDPEAIPVDTDYSSVIIADIPVVVQHSRLDSRQAENALLTTIAYPGNV